MAAEKISVTVDEDLMKWARGAAKKRRMTLSAVVAEALELQRQHQARERYLKEALSDISEEEIERRTAEAYREIFGQSDAAQ
jgi:post-segregation antitoxin (ccd killing protein)